MRSVAWRDLALQIGQFDSVVVDDADRADAGGGEIERERAAEAAGADDENPRLAQPRLADPADLLQQDVAGIADDLIVLKIEVHAADMGIVARRGKNVARELERGRICMHVTAVALGAALVGMTMVMPAKAAVNEFEFPPKTVADLVAICNVSKDDPLMTASVNYCHGFYRGGGGRRTGP